MTGGDSRSDPPAAVAGGLRDPAGGPALASDVLAGLERLGRSAPHLRWRLAGDGEPLAADELACAGLAADPDALAGAVWASAAGRGSRDRQVLASLWWQAYAYRVAGTALACWLLTGAAPPTTAERTAVGIDRARPASIAYLGHSTTAARRGAAPSRDPAPPDGGPGARSGQPGRPEAGRSRDRAPSTRRTGGDPPSAGPTGTAGVESGRLHALVAEVFPGHLDRVAASLRARHVLGRRLLWGNVAAACASAAGAVRVACGPTWRARLDAFLAAAPHDLASFGAWSDGAPAPGATAAGPAPPDHAAPEGPTYRRTSCCLWWKTSAAGGALCADCPLPRSPTEAPPA